MGDRLGIPSVVGIFWKIWGLWRNGSASDSRSEGCVFESRRAHVFVHAFFYWILMVKRLKGKKSPSLGGLEPPTFRLTAERANRLRHRDLDGCLCFLP